MMVISVLKKKKNWDDNEDASFYSSKLNASTNTRLSWQPWRQYNLFSNLIQWHTSRNFYVVVVPLRRTAVTVKNLKNPDEMDMEEVGKYVGFPAHLIVWQIWLHFMIPSFFLMAYFLWRGLNDSFVFISSYMCNFMFAHTSLDMKTGYADVYFSAMLIFPSKHAEERVTQASLLPFLPLLRVTLTSRSTQTTPIEFGITHIPSAYCLPVCSVQWMRGVGCMKVWSLNSSLCVITDRDLTLVQHSKPGKV